MDSFNFNCAYFAPIWQLTSPLLVHVDSSFWNLIFSGSSVISAYLRRDDGQFSPLPTFSGTPFLHAPAIFPLYSTIFWKLVSAFLDKSLFSLLLWDVHDRRCRPSLFPSPTFEHTAFLGVHV